MIVTDNSEQNCLLKLLRCVLKDEPFVPDKDINTAELLKLAVNQQVYTTVLPCLEQSGILTDKEKEKWNNYKLSEIQKNLIISSKSEARRLVIQGGIKVNNEKVHMSHLKTIYVIF